MAEACESNRISVLILSLKDWGYYDPDEYNFNKTRCEDCDIRVNSTEEMMLHLRTWDHYYEAFRSKQRVFPKEFRTSLPPDAPLIWIKEATSRRENRNQSKRFNHFLLGGYFVRDEDTPRSLGIRENDLIRIYDRDAVVEPLDLTEAMFGVPRYLHMMERKQQKEARKEKNVVNVLKSEHIEGHLAYQTSGIIDDIDIDAIVETINNSGSSGPQEKKKSKPKKSKKKKATGDSLDREDLVSSELEPSPAEPSQAEPVLPYLQENGSLGPQEKKKSKPKKAKKTKATGDTDDLLSSELKPTQAEPSQAEPVLPNLRENEGSLSNHNPKESTIEMSASKDAKPKKAKNTKATGEHPDMDDLLSSEPKPNPAKTVLPNLREDEGGLENVGNIEASVSKDTEVKIIEDRIKELGKEFDDHQDYVAEMIGKHATSVTLFMQDIDASEDKIYQNEKETKQIDVEIKGYQEKIEKLQLHQISLSKDSNMHKDLIKKKKKKLDGFERYRVQERTEAQKKDLRITEEIKRLEDQLSSLQMTDHNHNQEEPSKSNDVQTNDSQRLKEMFERTIKESIREKESSLECPVCFEIADIPIFRCTKEHLICPKCRPRVRDCPVCRETYRGPPERHRFAEKMVDELSRLREQLAGILG